MEDNSTQGARGDHEVDPRDDDPAREHSVLAEMARDPASGMVELTPGVYRVQRSPGDPSVSAF